MKIFWNKTTSIELANYIPGLIQLQPQRPSQRQRRFDDIQSLCELHLRKHDWPRALASSRSLGHRRSSYVIDVSSMDNEKK